LDRENSSEMKFLDQRDIQQEQAQRCRNDMSATSFSNVLTLDLEDWFHGIEERPENWGRFERRIREATSRLLNVLDQFSVKATFFVLGDVAKHDPSLIREIFTRGHEVGSHGMEHRFIFKQSPKQFRRDLRASLRLLESITGEAVRSFRAPYFSINSDTLWALSVLRQEGILYDSSIFPAYNHRYGIPGAVRMPHQILPRLWECPISTVPTPFGNIPFSGGAYFRILPWWVFLQAFRLLERRNEPIILYFHPYDFDASQPASRTRSYLFDFRRNFGIGASMDKLSKLLRLNSFTATLSTFMEAAAHGAGCEVMGLG
jgi:polysaccharide deacetylase family protein (PEP-CTERM system associated)